MRVLFLTTEFLWPAASGGPVRSLSQVRIIASLPEVESVTVMSLAEEPVAAAHVRAFEANVPKVSAIPPIFHPIHLWDFPKYVPRVVGLRMLDVPYLAGKWDSPAVRKMLRAELTGRDVDVVYIDHLGMARYLPLVKKVRPKARVILDQHNVESDFFKQFAEKQRGPKRLVAKAEAGCAVRFERRVMQAADAIVAISSEDAKHFRALAAVEPYVVPVVLPFERRTRTAPSKPHLCYVGNLRWHPNVAGLDWFCQKVWHKVRELVPDATLEIAGIGLKPDASGKLPVPEAWRVPGVETVGFLEDLEPLYARSVAMAAPVFGGSGVRLKLLEGLRAGIPVVTTSDGAFGLPLEDGREMLIADDETGFAERIARVLREAALRAELVQEGYAFLERCHSLAVAQAVMRRVLGLPQASAAAAAAE
jgi:polysaccharide biosynthesis protein PslH